MTPVSSPPTSVLRRRRWLIKGQVQGVGFRPFVYRAAQECGLMGFVRNSAEGVVIEGQGTEEQVGRFEEMLRGTVPPLARVRRVTAEDLEGRGGEGSFEIIESAVGNGASAVPEVAVDTATCGACVQEMLSPGDRRFGHGLINCTDCGPRFSIVRGVPYDRPQTTMAGFEMCPACAAEYAAPGDRRFHAQPIACRECGPRVALADHRGRELEGDPILGAVWRLAEGQVLAIKGLGGFHLAVRADDENAVNRLRKLKNRDYKPFAVMVASVEKARRVVELTERAAEVMRSGACPIVLARKRREQILAPGIAPQNHRLGVMLPYTPIHHLLFNRGAGWWWALVMTSGNVSDEPIVTENAEAVERLGPLCDAILWHDRPIERGVEDSVLLEMGAEEMVPLRRSRGYVPMGIELEKQEVRSKKQEDGLCVGGELKNVVGVVRGGRVILSQHLGDLTDVRALAHFGKATADLQALFGVKPAWVAHDLHPMYVSTQEAKKIAARLGVKTIGVQHHHAHAAACMAEHGEAGPVLAVVCDGTGYGTDGTIWGGELLQADLVGFERLARLRPLLLAGGDAAAKDVRRSALAMLVQAFGWRAGRHPAAVRLYPDEGERQVLVQMIRDGVNCAASSGAGRWFDGVAALLGLATHNHFEAQAALALEGAAERAQMGAPPATVWFDVRAGSVAEIDFTRLVRELVARMEMRLAVEDAAGLFHEQFARAWYAVVREAAERTGIRTVALSGGVFCNQRITRRLTELLELRDLRVLRHRVVPPNDGGLALGQAAVAAARMRELATDEHG